MVEEMVQKGGANKKSSHKGGQLEWSLLCYCEEISKGATGEKYDLYHEAVPMTTRMIDSVCEDDADEDDDNDVDDDDVGDDDDNDN